MNEAALHDGERSEPGASDRRLSQVSYADPGESPHVAHGLVAIANGPDYCLCGDTWPCDKRIEP